MFTPSSPKWKGPEIFEARYKMFADLVIYDKVIFKETACSGNKLRIKQNQSRVIFFLLKYYPIYLNDMYCISSVSSYLWPLHIFLIIGKLCPTLNI